MNPHLLRHFFHAHGLQADGPDLKKSSCLCTMTRARRKTVSCLISKARNNSCPSRNALRRYCLSSPASGTLSH